MSKDFHSISFNNDTLLKLEIYRSYINDWLPIFINREIDRSWNGKINIFDFFSGPGKDKDGKEGSPIVALRECLKFTDQLSNKGKTVNLYFSDDKKQKTEALKNVLSKWNLPDQINFEVSCNDFETEFESKQDVLKKSANLLFIDQCGIKEVNEDRFLKLINLKGSDMLFFIASSSFRRFRNSPEFKRYLDPSGRIDKTTPFDDSHRIIADMYREMIPRDHSYYLAPFSIKKSPNIYGLIFGTSNIVGIHRFLNICWKKDTERGEANFDIDNDNIPKSGDNLHLFDDNNKSKKVTKFQNELREKALSGYFSSDKEIFKFTLENGFHPTKHAKGVINSLIQEEKLKSVEGRPRFSKECLNGPRTIMRC